MRLFVTEFIVGGGIANDPLPDNLKQEGQMMLQAVLDECSKIPGIQLVTTCDARIDLQINDVEMHIVEDAIDYIQQVSLIAAQCDATWVIAPESGGILESITHRLLEEKITLINCDVESVHITSDKLMCAEYLMKHDILTIENLSLEQTRSYMKPVIIKDRCGAGCEGLMRCENGKQALECIENFSQWVVQPYLEGDHLSLSLLFSRQEVKILSINKQIFENIKQPKLIACHVNAYPVRDDMRLLAEKIFNAFPGLQGYVGVDVIETQGKHYIVDINPRLTSSFVGLSAVLEDNPAAMCINSVLKSALPKTINISSQVVEVKVV